MKTQTFEQLIQLTSQELFEWIHATQNDSSLLNYAKCLYAYLVSDIDSLNSGITHFERYSDPKSSSYRDIAILRRSVRLNNVAKEKVTDVEKHLNQSIALDGEIYFVMAQAFERLEDEAKVLQYYRQSFEALKLAGIQKKAVLAAMNMVACKDRMNKNSVLMPEYFNIVSMAKEAKAYSPLGTALLNIAREFSLAKSYQAALKYSTEAVDILREHMYGSYQYYFALCNRCDIYCKLGDSKAALADFEEASVSKIPEIKGALNVLTSKISKAKRNSLKGNKRTISSWKNRLDSLDMRFTKMEVKLIETLEAGSISFDVLIERLYDEKASLEIKSNRARQLIFRLRKKMPGCIKHEAGLVSLERPVSPNRRSLQ